MYLQPPKILMPSLIRQKLLIFFGRWYALCNKFPTENKCTTVMGYNPENPDFQPENLFNSGIT